MDEEMIELIKQLSDALEHTLVHRPMAAPIRTRAALEAGRTWLEKHGAKSDGGNSEGD